ncbi:MAG TPA: ribosome silencing factor [Rhizomicrobium sp.]|nr:ribosome silencing factor [Rhizomicrobium sp.]
MKARTAVKASKTPKASKAKVAKAPAPVKAKAKAKPVKKKIAPPAAKVEKQPRAEKTQTELSALILKSLDDDKAEDIVTIDLEGRSSLADALVIATGRSSRHVASIAEHLARKLKEAGYGTRPIDGAAQGDWVLVDAGDVIVHVFRPEVRSYYDLEGMWSVDEPPRRATG